MTALVDLVLGALDIRAAFSNDRAKQKKLLTIGLGIVLAVAIFDPF